jgi:2,4-dienoyl-CoA reductase-like NADH-dependent reductase (Old Yellow Enzyme family)
MRYRRIASLKTADGFHRYLAGLGVDLPFDEEVLSGPDAPLAQPYRLPDGFTVGNRFCIHPMEGWDGTPDGRPTDLTRRRWTHFGQSGAKLIWGGEAVAVCHAGRANPKQLLINEANWPALAELRWALVESHEACYGSSADLLVGLQLTHSGRFARPNRKDRLEPVILYHHPYLDRKFGLPGDYPLMSDAQIEELIRQFVQAAEMAQAAGFAFVDVKHCHGYLGHEFLSAVTRPGPYGGSFESRTRFLREVVQGVHQRAPGLRIGVRLSAFDTLPFAPGPTDGVGVPVDVPGCYPFAFGADPDDPLRYRLDETVRFLELLEELGIYLVNLSAGSPYYNPHIQRPALFPPSDGYGPPEDPLVGVARQVGAVAELKRCFPGLLMVGSAYTYLQEWLPHVAQYNVRCGRVDFVGLGRMVLAYPDFPADVLAGRPLDRRRICRTLSDCTTAPRNGLVSGCYPLDEFYAATDAAVVLSQAKRRGAPSS